MRIALVLTTLLFLLSFCAGEKHQNQHKKITAKKKSNMQQDEFSEDQLQTIKQLLSNTPQAQISAVDAAATYKTYCGLCHGQKGEMSINGAKILMDTNTSLSERVAQIYFGKGTMTPFKGTLKDEQIIAVAQYIDELKK